MLFNSDSCCYLFPGEHAFINYLDTEIKGTLLEFTEETKLGRAVDSLEGEGALQRDWGGLQSWTINSCMKLEQGSLPGVEKSLRTKWNMEDKRPAP